MSLSLVSVPVIRDTATDARHLGKQWARLFHQGHRIFPAMAVATSLIYGYTAATTGRWTFALAAVANVSIAPFTRVFMMATERQLSQLAPESSQRSQLDAAEMLIRVKGLVTNWAWLHFVRALLPLAGTMVAISATFA